MLPFEIKGPVTLQTPTSCAMLIYREMVRSTMSFVYWRVCLGFEVNAFAKSMTLYTPFQIGDRRVIQSSVN